MADAPRAFLDNVLERRKYICSGGARVDSPNFCEIGLIGDLGDKKGIILSLFSFFLSPFGATLQYTTGGATATVILRVREYWGGGRA